jgi:hypothetical protein
MAAVKAAAAKAAVAKAAESLVVVQVVPPVVAWTPVVVVWAPAAAVALVVVALAVNRHFDSSVATQLKGLARVLFHVDFRGAIASMDSHLPSRILE